jgi:DHA1 family tetracycline resistance protein-like MFS transporter
VVCFGCCAGIAGPALQAYTTKHVPANEQGAVQGVFAGLQSLAGIPGPLIALSSFSWAIGSGNAVHLPSLIAGLDRPLTRLLSWLAPLRLPGIAFFEAAALSSFGLFLAIRSFRRDAVAAAELGTTPLP